MKPLGMDGRLLALFTGAMVVLAATAIYAFAQSKQAEAPKAAAGKYFKPEESQTSGSVVVDGHNVAYDAVAGTLVVHPKGWDDVKPPDEKNEKSDESKSQNPSAEASMFYVAYFKKGASAASRPLMFLFNGGPGSSSVWLHMGAFGPKRACSTSRTSNPAPRIRSAP